MVETLINEKREIYRISPTKIGKDVDFKGNTLKGKLIEEGWKKYKQEVFERVQTELIAELINHTHFELIDKGEDLFICKLVLSI